MRECLWQKHSRTMMMRYEEVVRTLLGYKNLKAMCTQIGYTGENGKRMNNHTNSFIYDKYLKMNHVHSPMYNNIKILNLKSIRRRYYV